MLYEIVLKKSALSLKLQPPTHDIGRKSDRQNNFEMHECVFDARAVTAFPTESEKSLNTNHVERALYSVSTPCLRGYIYVHRTLSRRVKRVAE